jgi:hypothetical protein
MKIEFIKEEMRLCRSTIRLQIKDLYTQKKTQLSH